MADELAKLNETDKAGYLLALLDVAETPWAKARAEMEFDQVMQDSIDGLQHQAEQDEMRTYLDGFRREHDSPLDAFVGLLVAEQKRTQVEPLLKWLVSVGGLKKPSSGSSSGARGADAAYVMSDDLLGTLVHVAAAETTGLMSSADGTSVKLPMSAFLAFLRPASGSSSTGHQPSWTTPRPARRHVPTSRR